jgi:peptidoglycan hydrolase CwlO-like protein
VLVIIKLNGVFIVTQTLLEATQKTVKECKEKINDLEEKMKDMKLKHDEKVMKMDSQLAQQNKLIAFLQSKNESSKKKRVLFLNTYKRFGH